MKVSKKILAVLLAVITVFGVMCIAASAADQTVYVISGNIDIGINSPIAGEKPSIDTTLSSDKFTVTAFTWYDKKTGAIIDPAGTAFTFENGGEYTAKITVSPIESYVFADDITVTVNGSSPSTVRFQDNTITVECSFTCDKGANGNSFFSALGNVLLKIFKILRDIISHIIGL